MNAEPAYDASNIHLTQGRTASSAQFHATGPAEPETAGLDNEPIHCTLTPKAEAFLAALKTEPQTEPEPEPEDGA